MSRDAAFNDNDQLPCGCALYTHDHHYRLSPCALHADAQVLLAWLQAFVAMMDYHGADVKLSFSGSVLNEDLLAALQAARPILASATERSEASS